MTVNPAGSHSQFAQSSASDQRDEIQKAISTGMQKIFDNAERAWERDLGDEKKERSCCEKVLKCAKTVLNYLRPKPPSRAHEHIKEDQKRLLGIYALAHSNKQLINYANEQGWSFTKQELQEIHKENSLYSDSDSEQECEAESKKNK